jgi:hypothetical protein
VATSLDVSKLRMGDLLFFKRGSRSIGHTGIYIGDGKMIHSTASHKQGVTISDLSSTYYVRNFVVAKRLFVFSPPEKTVFKEYQPGTESYEIHPAD